MSSRDEWMKLLASIIDDEQHDTAKYPCPHCGRHQLDLRYVGYPETGLASVYFWCDNCLHGIDVSRAKAPRGVPVHGFDEPGIPDYARCD